MLRVTKLGLGSWGLVALGVRDGVRVVPEPDGDPFAYEEIVRLAGRPVTPQEVCWANLGALVVWGKPLGDVVEDLWTSGKSLTAAEFERLVSTRPPDACSTPPSSL